jgi:phosphopantetheinyl transferase (holo-ACP synthase)
MVCTVPPHLARVTDDALGLARSSLTREEEARLDVLVTEKRRRDFLLGRLAAKDAVRRALRSSSPPAGKIAILSDENGAPFAVVDGERAASLSLSLSHGHGQAVALARESGLVGLDLERIRERPEGTFRFYMSDEERDRYVSSRLPGCLRDEAAVVLWALKEAAWKALRPGRGAGLLDVFLSLESPTGSREGSARVRFSGPLRERARQEGVAPAGLAAWRREGDLVVAWALVGEPRDPVSWGPTFEGDS